MATDFFQRQATARKSTSWLLFMFCLATLAIVVSIMVIAAIVVATPGSGGRSSLAGNGYPWQVPVLAGIVTLLLILGGSFFKVLELRAGGGAGVAERLGGVRVFPNSNDPIERRLLNVVEEMAIASGTPVPPVFMLKQEQGINAFAAGYSPGDAVLGITRGCAERLTRDELQGVIAHEFSHILNGDMKISIRVMGILHGVLLLGLVGQLVFRSIAYSGRSSSRRDSDAGKAVIVILVIAVALIVIGFMGTMIGNLIKAAVSRQRERLADASGVQFTRNPAGLSGALKRIGAAATGSRLEAANAAIASHMFFAEGVWQGLAGLWSTHPPLAERIRALDPGWDGKFPAANAADKLIEQELSRQSAGQSSFVGERAASEIPLQIVDHAVEHVGNPTMAHVAYAASLRPLIPPQIIAAAREPYAARAIIFTLLLNKETNVRNQQFVALNRFITKDVKLVMQKLVPLVDQLDARVRLPLVDIALPALAAMSRPQYQQFMQAFETLALADGQLDLFEWVLSQIVARHLRPHFESVPRNQVRFANVQKLTSRIEVVLSAVAYGGNTDREADRAFAAATKHFPELNLHMQTDDAASLKDMRQALAALALATPKDRGRLVDACAEAISADRHATLQEVELLRGISDLLDCPMPPLLVNQD